MSANDDDDPGPDTSKYAGLKTGQVVDISDPEGRGRIRFMIPNLMEPASPWARMGNGGGIPQRGPWRVPPVGSTVDVFFQAGDDGPDPTQPVYYTGEAGTNGALSHIKTPPRGGPVAPKDSHLVWGWEGERYAIQIDERPGNEYMQFWDKTDQTGLILDGLKGAAWLTARTQVALSCPNGNVAIKASSVSIQGRPVRTTTTEPI